MNHNMHWTASIANGIWPLHKITLASGYIFFPFDCHFLGIERSYLHQVGGLLSYLEPVLTFSYGAWVALAFLFSAWDRSGCFVSLVLFLQVEHIIFHSLINRSPTFPTFSFW